MGASGDRIILAVGCATEHDFDTGRAEACVQPGARCIYVASGGTSEIHVPTDESQIVERRGASQSWVNFRNKYVMHTAGRHSQLCACFREGGDVSGLSWNVHL